MTRLRSRVTLVALLAVALTRCAGCSPEDEDCSSGLTFCGGVCADLATNAQNCGACFNVCPATATCSGGACLCPNPGDVVCSGACVDPASYATDPANCGACGVACGFGTCAGGVCQCETEDGGGMLCPGQNPRCANKLTDPANCGACGNACEAVKPGSGCDAGTCACVAPKDDDCVTFCTDTLTDPANCGADGAPAACGNKCPLTNEACADGICACPTDFPVACPTAAPTACVNLQTDRTNCGTCGNACPKTNEICTAGVCGCPSDLPDTCNAACVDRATDELNCSACGVRCATGATCTGGQCLCPTGENVCEGACVDKLTDEANCGACGTVCPSAATCASGTCTCPAASPVACGSSCCAGTACCPNNTCQTAHSNGLDQTYYSCDPLGTYNFAAAQAAALAWDPGGRRREFLGCSSQDCLGWESSTQCAVWCYGNDILRGRVVVALNQVCTCPSAGAPNWN